MMNKEIVIRYLVKQGPIKYWDGKAIPRFLVSEMETLLLAFTESSLVEDSKASGLASLLMDELGVSFRAVRDEF